MDMYKLSGHLIGCVDATSITLQDLYLLHLQGIFGIKQKDLHNIGDKGAAAYHPHKLKDQKKLLFIFEAINFCPKLHENMPLHSQVIFIFHAIHACHTMSYGLNYRWFRGFYFVQERWTKCTTVYWPWQGSLKRLETTGFLITSMAHV